jgi:hypothetical protein
MTKELDLARKLVALATDPATTEAEARTAALAACRVIRQHKLLERSPVPTPRPGVRPGGGFSYVGFDVDLTDLADLMRQWAQRAAPPRPPPKPPPPKAKPYPPPKPPPRKPDTRSKEERVEACFRDLRWRTPDLPMEVLRRAAQASVEREMEQEAAERRAHAGGRR